MRHFYLLPIVLGILSACSTDAEPTSGGALDVYRDPCDLSEIAAIDVSPGDSHYVVKDGKLFKGDIDFTDFLKPLICAPYPAEMTIQSVESGDWVTVQSGNASAAVLGRVLTDGEPRLSYETRTFGADGKLFVATGEVLERSRTWRTFGSFFATGSSLELDKSFEQVLAETPSPNYVPLTFTYTFQ